MKLILLGLLMLGCTHRPQTLRISSWGIQLQGYEKNDSLRKISGSEKELWVVDPDAFTSSTVKGLKQKPKKVIAYLSLGETEGYRKYFKDLPKDLILEENPDWKDNFTVKFWDDRWGRVVQGSLLEIQTKGFDGVFLDVVDAFERFPDKKTKAQAMAQLISSVAKTAREQDPHFIIIMQNGLQIRRYLQDPKILLDSISAVNAENVFAERGPELLGDLAFYRNAEKLILSLEYIDEEKDRERYLRFAREQDILPQLSDPALDGTKTVY